MKKVLFIFDGGLAPGYAAVAAGLTEEGEKQNWECWVCRKGFRSICEGLSDEPQLLRVVTNPAEAFELNYRGIPTEIVGRRSLLPGSDFRSERFPEFARQDMLSAAAQSIVYEKFEIVIFCGGDGTLRGAKDLVKLLPTHVQTGFINISADSDIANDRSVGFLSCAEHGATIARGLYEDAYTHRRIYVLEMMGNKSGRHALHAGAAAKAHLIILPCFDFGESVFAEIAQSLMSRRHALIVIAEGYKRDQRKATQNKLNAAEYFAMELREYGLADQPNKRVIAEPFSRYLRGVNPLLIDCGIAHLKCQILVRAITSGQTQIMARYESEHDMGLQSFADAHSFNDIDHELISMLDRLDLMQFRTYVRDVFCHRAAEM